MGGLLWGSPAGAGEPILTIRVLDQETGRELSDPQCALVDPVRRVARAKFRGWTYSGDVTPRAGDELFVYRRGYDLARVALDPSERTVTARLRRARTCVVRVGSGDHPGMELAVVTALKAWQPSPILDEHRVALPADGRLEVPVPEGLQPFIVVLDGEHCAWPKAFWVQAGGAYDVTVESPRLLRVLRDAQPPRVGTSVETYLDLLWDPPFERARVDAWRNMAAFESGWLAEAFRKAGEFMSVLPDAPFHLFVVLDNRPVYRYVSRRDEVLDLRRPFRTKVVAHRPIVDGRPVPPGTVLAPGRLDRYAVSDLTSPSGSGRFHHRTADVAVWPEIRLPPSEWLTIWHPDHGLAHVAWREGRTPRGRTYPGRLTVTAPEGFRATGYVLAYPTWPGEWRVTPVTARLRRDFGGSRSISFPGMRPAHYGLDIQVTLTEVVTGRVAHLQQLREITVTEKDLSPTYRLSVPRK